MPTIDELNVRIGATFDASGFNKAIAATEAVGAAAEAASGRFTDASGRLRESNGRFVSAATLAAEAAGKFGGSVASAAGQVSGLNAQLLASFKQYDKVFEPLNDGVGRLGRGLKDVGSGLTTYVTLPLGLLAGASLSAFGKLDSLRRGLEAVAAIQLNEKGITGVQALGQAATETKQRLKELEVIARAPGIGFEQAVKGDVRLRAVGFTAEDSAKALREFANAIATTGGSASDLDGVTVQLAQLSAKGKVLAQDLRPIIERAPLVAAALKNLFGTVDSEDISGQLEKLGQNSTDFIRQLTDELAKAPRVTGGLSNSFENLQQSGVQALGKVGDALNRAFNIGPNLDRLGDFITGLADKFEALDPSTQKLIFGLAGAAAAAGPLLVAIGSIGIAVPAITAGFATLGLTSVAALGPVGIAAAAVAAAALVVYENWDKVVSYFEGEGGRAFGDLADAASDAAGEIVGAFGDIAGAYLQLSGVFVSPAGSPIGKFTTFLVDNLSGALGVISNGIKLTSALLRGEWGQAFTAAEAGGRAFLKPYLEIFANRPTGSGDGAPSEVLKLVTGLDFATTAASQLGTALNKALKPALTEEQQKALDKLEKELLDNRNASRALGKDYDFLGSKAKILESGIKSLTDVGFAPGGRVVQEYVRQLRGVPEALDRISARVAKGTEKLFETPEFKLEGGLSKLGLPEKLATVAVDTTETKNSLTDLQNFLIENNQFLANSAAGIGFTIGEALVNGADVVSAAGGQLLKALAELAAKKGSLLIAEGTAELFIPGLQAHGAGLIAAGSALVLAAGIAGAKGGNLAKSSAGGGSLASTPRTNYSSSYVQRPEPLEIRITGELVGRGSELAAVIRTADYRRQRSG